MSKAEDILRQQKEEQTATKTAEESSRIAKANLEEHETQVKRQTIDAGFDPADPIKGWHDAVAAFNKEKDEFDAEKQRFAAWVTDYNLNLERLNAEKKTFQEEVTAQQVKSKAIDDTISAKAKELAAKAQELTDRQKALQVVANEIATKRAELDNINTLINTALRKCKKLVLEAADRHDYYYDLALSNSWGKFTAWVKDLFRDLRL